MDRRINGDPRRSPRDEKLSTPSGLEGSSGSSGFGCRGVAGWVATHILFPPGEVSERSKEHAWKVCIRQRIEGSNPSLSANFSAYAEFVGVLKKLNPQHSG